MTDVFLVLIGWAFILALPFVWVGLIVKWIWESRGQAFSNIYRVWIAKLLLVIFSFLSGIALWAFYLPVFQNYAMNVFSDVVDNELELARHLPKYGYLLSANKAVELLEDSFKKILQPTYSQIIGDSGEVFVRHSYVVIRVQTTSSMYAGTLAYRIDGGEWLHVDIMTLEGKVSLANSTDAAQYQTIIVPARSIRIPKDDRIPVVDVQWVRFYKIPNTNIPKRWDFYEG